MSNLIFSSATAQAEAIRRKSISSLELINACIARIEAVNKDINAVVQSPFGAARDAARAADANLAKGNAPGALHGVPFTIKDTIDTAGVITTGGTQGRASFVPEHDATVVARLRSAGAILLGKTNTPELALAGETDNLIYGRTNNPYDLSRTPGGSSGGAAAIIAAGGSPLDIGTDAWGSIRTPAHCCGIVGLKPSFGRVPRTGSVLPLGLGAIDRLIHFGPMARRIEDLTLTLPIISGIDWRDPTVVPMPLGNSADVDLDTLRVAYYSDNGIVSPTSDTREVLRSASMALSDGRSTVTEHRPEGIEVLFELLISLSVADGGAWIKRVLESCGTKEIHPWLNIYFQNEQTLTAADYSALLERLDQFRARMLAFIENYDVILCPAYDAPAALHGQSSYNGFTYTALYSLTGWPAAVVRCGTSPDGMPIGVQVIGRPWRDDVVLRVAEFLERTLGGYQEPSV